MKNVILLMVWLINIGMNEIVFDFEKKSNLKNWFVVNDGVMGGLSDGQLLLNEAGNAVFSGTVSLENNGGFTSLRHSFESKDIAGKTTACLHLKGDGKRYQFRIKTNRDDRHSYIYYFETSKEWEVIEIPLAEMYPSFRGRKLWMPNFSATYISEITFLIANKKAEEFRLEIDKITLK